MNGGRVKNATSDICTGTRDSEDLGGLDEGGCKVGGERWIATEGADG